MPLKNYIIKRMDISAGAGNEIQSRSAFFKQAIKLNQEYAEEHCNSGKEY
jgi:hypothetical protein